MKLSEKEEKHIRFLKKSHDTMYLSYIAGGFSLLVAVIGLYFGIVKNLESGYYGAIIWCYLGITVILISQRYRKSYQIMLRMKLHIEEMEKKLGEKDSD